MLAFIFLIFGFIVSLLPLLCCLDDFKCSSSDCYHMADVLIKCEVTRGAWLWSGFTFLGIHIKYNWKAGLPTVDKVEERIEMPLLNLVEKPGWNATESK